MARKPKPRISQEEQSKRFIEAAREAGVPDDLDLEGIVRRIALLKKKKTKTFTAKTEANAKRKLGDWIQAHPKATILRETIMPPAKGSTMTRPGGSAWVTIFIEYEQ